MHEECPRVHDTHTHARARGDILAGIVRFSLI